MGKPAGMGVVGTQGGRSCPRRLSPVQRNQQAGRTLAGRQRAGALCAIPGARYLRGDYRVTYIGHSQVWTAAPKTLEPVPVFGPPAPPGAGGNRYRNRHGRARHQYLVGSRFIRSLQLDRGCATQPICPWR